MHTSPFVLKSPTHLSTFLVQKGGTSEDSDLSELSADDGDMPRQLSSQLQYRERTTAPILLDYDDEAGTIKRPRPRINRSKIILSEDEVVEIDQHPIKTRKPAPQGRQQAITSKEPSMQIEAIDRGIAANGKLASVPCSRLQLPHEMTDTVCDNDVRMKCLSAHQQFDTLTTDSDARPGIARTSNLH